MKLHITSTRLKNNENNPNAKYDYEDEELSDKYLNNPDPATLGKYILSLCAKADDIQIEIDKL